MQVIKKNGKPFKVIADEEMRLTKNREFFVKTIYLGINDKVENYEEVPYEIWGLFVEDEIPKNKVEELQQQINILQEDKENLEFVLLDTNFRLTCMELKDEGILE